MPRTTTDRPDLSHSVPGTDVPLRSFRAGAHFARIYDRTKSIDPASGSRSYLPLDFNSKLIPDKKRKRGRFSACLGTEPSERYSYLYLGEERHDERTVLLECIDLLHLGRTDHERGIDRLLDVDSVGHLSFVYASLKRPITLLDITTSPYADRFKARLEILQGDDHQLTREWGRYFRGVADFVDGFCYTPKKYGSAEYGANVVLFADYECNGTMLHDEYSEFALNSREGIARLTALSSVTNICPIR